MADEEKLSFRDRAALAAVGQFEMDKAGLRGIAKGHFQDNGAMAKYCFNVADALEAEREKRNRSKPGPKPKVKGE